MWVILRANWFVGGRRIRRGNPPSTPVEVPDEYRDILPKGAVIVDEGYEPPESVVTDIRTLSEMARRRGGSLIEHLSRNRRPQVLVAPEPQVPVASEPTVTDNLDEKVEPEIAGIDLRDPAIEAAKQVLHEGEPPFKVIGGGWYEFPDGTRVQGLEKAKARVIREAETGDA